MPYFALIIGAMLWFLAGFISGVTSFGGNLVAVPLLAMLQDPRDAIFTGCIVGGLTAIYLALIYRKSMDFGEIAPLCAGVVPGIPLGVIILDYASPRALLIIVGISLILFLVWQLASARIFSSKKPLSKMAAMPCGIVSGILLGSTSMGGPPLVLYAFLRGWGKENTVANLSFTAAVATIIWVSMQFWHGAFASAPIAGCVTGAVAAALGTLASVPVLRHVNVFLFRRLLLGMVGFSAFMAFMRACF